MSSEIGAASFGLVVGLSKFRKQLSEGEQIADRSGRAMGEKIGSGIDKGLGPGLDRAGQRLQNFGGSISATGSRLTMMTAPLLAAGAGAVKLGADFDTSMTRIETLVGLSREQVDQLRGSVRELAGSTAKSPRELADALFFATSAGLSSADALAVVEAAAKGSAIGLGDTATITDLATSAMNAYGPSVLSATDATDTLMGAVRLGKLGPAELAGAMGQVLPVASAMGVGFDEVGAAMAAMSRTGTSASEASTQLRSILTGILSPSTQARDALSDVGLSVDGLQRSLGEQGLLPTLEQIVTAFGGNVAATEAVFGNVRALSGVLDMLGSNAQGTRDIFAGMADTTGMVNQGFERVAETGGHKMAQAWASMQEQLVQVGDILLPTVAAMATGVTALVSVFGMLPGPLQQVVVGSLAFVAVAGPLMLVVGKMISGIGLLVSGVGKLIALMSGLGKVAMLSNPWVLAIVAALAGIALVVYHWETLKEWFSSFFDWFKRTAGALIDWLKDNWQTVAAILTGPIGIAVLAITKNWDTIQAGAAAAAKWVIDRLSSIVSFVTSMPGMIADVGRNMFDSLVDGFKAAINWIIRGWNSLKFTVPTLDTPLGPLGGWTIGVSQIPELDVGGRITSSGLAVVHKGEIVVPAARADTPYDRVSHQLAGDGAGGALRPIHVTLDVDGRVLGRVVVDQMADRERITGRAAFGRSGGRRL